MAKCLPEMGRFLNRSLRRDRVRHSTSAGRIAVVRSRESILLKASPHRLAL
jgi:hypothetical protein